MTRPLLICIFNSNRFDLPHIEYAKAVRMGSFENIIFNDEYFVLTIKETEDILYLFMYIFLCPLLFVP